VTRRFYRRPKRSTSTLFPLPPYRFHPYFDFPSSIFACLILPVPTFSPFGRCEMFDIVTVIFQPSKTRRSYFPPPSAEIGSLRRTVHARTGQPLFRDIQPESVPLLIGDYSLSALRSYAYIYLGVENLLITRIPLLPSCMVPRPPDFPPFLSFKGLYAIVTLYFSFATCEYFRKSSCRVPRPCLFSFLFLIHIVLCFAIPLPRPRKTPPFLNDAPAFP